MEISVNESNELFVVTEVVGIFEYVLVVRFPDLSAV
jgi:hypothetical protein